MRNPQPLNPGFLAECPPEMAGLNRRGVERIWREVERWYGTGLHPAITLVLRRHGKVVLRRAIGPATAREGAETPICLFSASKAITALLMHKLVELKKLRLEDRVVEYLPEFGAHGKERVTLRQLLAHRAGIPSIPVKKPDASLLHDWDRAVQLLCAAKPLDPSFEKQAYHAITAGFIIGEVVQRVSGMSLREALKTWIADPLQCRLLTYGLAENLRPQPAPSKLTGPRPFWPLGLFFKRVLGVPFETAVDISNTGEFLSAVVPSGNIFATADDACRVYQMLLNGGEFEGVRVFQPETIAEAVRPLGRRKLDGMLGVPLRFSAGFMLGDAPFGLYGQTCSQAYGHLGFMNVMCWADPQREISVALLNSGKSFAPRGVYRLARVLRTINRVCA